ncbi:MAG TPA: hypothetical protein VML75_05970 [Kofleriaceae bacterium]|nr:hypothetical protein [Kofleriaceae bacterium]
MSATRLPACLTRLPVMDDAWAERDAGMRLAAVRRSARALHDRIAEAGNAVSVRTFPIITFPYPTTFGLGGAASSPAPFVMMRNRMQLVQVEHRGELINLLVNPSDPERSLEAPFFATQLERYGEFVSRRVMSKRHGSVEQALRSVGVRPEDIHFITFDHLHVQDLRGWLGTSEPEPGFEHPTPAFLPNARLLAQAAELATFATLHPLQRFWYVADGLTAIPANKIVALDGDYLLGAGFALVRTPGHTAGNHSPVVSTDRGLWTISENGIAVECYAPAHSAIRGLRAHARSHQVEVILNANTRENTLDQYTSMVLEKTLADPCPERPEFPQHFPSSELVRSPLAPGLRPTYSHRHITHGVVRASAGAASAASAA